MNVYLISGGGTDAGGWIWVPGHGFKRIPGWNPEALAELKHATSIIREATHFKTPGLADAAVTGLMQFVEKQVEQYAKEGGALVIA